MYQILFLELLHFQQKFVTCNANLPIPAKDVYVNLHHCKTMVPNSLCKYFILTLGSVNMNSLLNYYILDISNCKKSI